MAKTVWVLSDGKKGTENQSIGLARALGYGSFELKKITAKFPWSFLPPKLWVSPLKAIKSDDQELSLGPWPDILITGGRICAAVAAEIRRQAAGKTFTIFIQDPYLSPDNFDIVIAPEHDSLQGANVIKTFGSLHNLSQEKLQEAKSDHANLINNLPAPRVAVLIGGKTRHYKMTSRLMEQYGSQLRHIAKRYTISYMVTGSRRTPLPCLQAFKRGLGSAPSYLWNGRGPNPYLTFLATADVIMVTSDSISMISEAAFTNKPIYILELEGSSRKFDKFIKLLYEKGIARPFSKEVVTWEYEPVDTMGQLLKDLKKYLPK